MENVVLDLFQRIGVKEIEEEERNECDKVIERIVGFAEISRKDGLLALEAKVNEQTDPFLRLGLNLAVDGCDSGLIAEILCTHIVADNYRDFLKRIIISEGVRSIVCGDNLRILKIRLKAFLGGL